jgi:hypothetical protein
LAHSADWSLWGLLLVAAILEIAGDLGSNGGRKATVGWG